MNKMKKARKIIPFLIVLFLSIPTFAQREKDSVSLKEKIKDMSQVVVKKSNKEFTLKGTIIDKKTKEPLIGVNIFWDGYR